MDQYESPSLIDHLPDFLACRIRRRDRGANRDAPAPGNLGGHEADPPEARIAIAAAMVRFPEQILARHFLVEQRYRPPPDLQQFRTQRFGDGACARTLRSGDEHGKPLPMPRQNTAFELPGYCWEGEPMGYVTAFVQTPAQFGAGDVQLAHPCGNLILRHQGAELLNVNHHAERDYADANFILILQYEFLRVVWTIEWLAVGSLARTGMITPDNEMGAPEILADDGVPDRVARTGHAHRQRQQRKLHHACGIVG